MASPCEMPAGVGGFISIVLHYFTSRIRWIRLISLDAKRQISHALRAYFTSEGYFTKRTCVFKFYCYTVIDGCIHSAATSMRRRSGSSTAGTVNFPGSTYGRFSVPALSSVSLRACESRRGNPSVAGMASASYECRERPMCRSENRKRHDTQVVPYEIIGRTSPIGRDRLPHSGQ